MSVATKQDFERMTAEEYASIRELLHGLTEEQWDEPSLCAGWKVRHVVGHICQGSQVSPLALPVRLIPYGFNIAKASSRSRTATARSTPPRSCSRPSTG